MEGGRRDGMGTQTSQVLMVGQPPNGIGFGGRACNRVPRKRLLCKS